MHKPFSFSPLRRIRERPDFQRTFRNGKRLYSPLYILYHRPNDLSYARIGAVISKRNVKKAVYRNQIKRVVRETFRLQQAELKPIDMVLVAQKKAGIASKEELKQCLEQLFVKLKK